MTEMKGIKMNRNKLTKVASIASLILGTSIFFTGCSGNFRTIISINADIHIQHIKTITNDKSGCV